MGNEQTIRAINQKEILEASDVIIIFGISRTTLWRFRKQGILHSFSVGRRLYFKKEEIQRVIDKERKAD
jgi:predicted site-specific integrase-resolvase